MLCSSRLRFPHHNLLYKPLRPSLSKTLCSFLPYPTRDDDVHWELGRLLALLPPDMSIKVRQQPEFHNLVEVVMDLGRKPLARFLSGDVVLSDSPITLKDLQHAISQVGDFAVDNRAGISRTLHRISAIRNRNGQIIGLTCRVGRAIPGSASLLRDLVQDGASLLLIGPPGVGKTTIIREIARMLANDYKKRVMIVDTSNEIGGDGDIPHAGIGNARRMQVPNSDMQHKVLIEAVENHMPQVIVIDEIGTKLEAMAASTIAQRGIQLVATAHGVAIENLMQNPSLEMLVGGIQSVTLGDEEANRRGVQKTVLERKGPSTFVCGVEIVSKTELRVHRSLEATVDAILSGCSPNVEVRKMHSQGLRETVQNGHVIDKSANQNIAVVVEDLQMTNESFNCNEGTIFSTPFPGDKPLDPVLPLRLYIYGISEESAIKGINQLKMDNAVQLTFNISEADAVLGLQSKLKKNPRVEGAAKSHGIPVYVTKTSSLGQITKAIRALTSNHASASMAFGSNDNLSLSEKMDALEEARIAIERVVIPKGQPVELFPRSSEMISLQMGLIQKYQLASEKLGTETDMRLRILPLHSRVNEDGKLRETNGSGFDDFGGAGNDTNGLPYRLPLLPDQS